ncbi:MAG: endolytic transglycosylase MltG [Glaciimonas sp.]|nr:endolytic transglycosylase MltG [Glaciimonas sp.]
MKKLLLSCILLMLLAGAGLLFWATQPIQSGVPGVSYQNVPFTIKPGSHLRSTADQIVAAGIPVNAELLTLLARITGQAGKIKAGSYELKSGATPKTLLRQMVLGQFAQESLIIIEGWTFKQMRTAIAANPGLKHDTIDLTDAQLLAKISIKEKYPEGLFFPDTYLFAKGASDLQIYRQANTTLMAHLNEAWSKRDASLPYKTPYEALIMASIVEKETGKKADRNTIASVFINRLKAGMMLQTDPTVIYGMGALYNGNISKRDLQTDTAYNTYTRIGLPPTPIALPGAESLRAALAPANTDSLYFVARGDGSSQFSSNLDDHNRAVNKYIRGGN